MKIASDELWIIVWDWFAMASGWVALLCVAAAALVVIDLFLRRILWDMGMISKAEVNPLRRRRVYRGRYIRRSVSNERR